MRCKDSDFTEGVEAVDTACCDYDGCSGVPTTCDAKCAVVYNDFFDQCSSKLQKDDLGQMQAYTNLYSTCSGLPTEPLLRAVIDCQVPTPTPATHTPAHPLVPAPPFPPLHPTESLPNSFNRCAAAGVRGRELRFTWHLPLRLLHLLRQLHRRVLRDGVHCARLWRARASDRHRGGAGGQLLLHVQLRLRGDLGGRALC
eukprot:COSAG04_NODE_11380_length_712_cov_1.265905_1_plen_198_part_10